MQVENRRMTLRSSVPKEEKQIKIKRPEDELINRPFIDYKGKIEYCTQFVDFTLICDILLKKAETAEDVLVLGFDLEWYFSFRTGPDKTAVMQINADLDTCFIIHLSAMDKLPKGLSELLIHPKVRLTGVNVKNDVRKLSRDYPGFNGDKIVENCIDLSTFANSVLPFQQRWSMEKLVGYFFKLNINKDKEIRKSKWHIVPLTKKQMIYAAIDSYASLKLYLHIKELELKKMEEMKENDAPSFSI